LEAILAQKDTKNKEYIVAYTSRGFNSPEKNYFATEIECLAAIWTMQYFCSIFIAKKLEL
ncbi:17120_t:CDS:1, partial [Gigaspora rosea]